MLLTNNLQPAQRLRITTISLLKELEATSPFPKCYKEEEQLPLTSDERGEHGLLRQATKKMINVYVRHWTEASTNAFAVRSGRCFYMRGTFIDLIDIVGVVVVFGDPT